MVIRDLSSYSVESNKPSGEMGAEGRPLASVADRLLAFSIDFFLFSPVVHLLLSFILKKIEILSIAAPDSLELLGLVFVAVVVTASFVIMTQTLFLALWGGTPGKLFLKLRVVPGDDHLPVLHDFTQGLNMTQALVRSVLWVVQVFLFFLPFLEILSHRQRKALHDRGAETVVITLKQTGDSGPHPLESNFIRQVLVVAFCLIASWIFFGIGRAYHLSLSGAFKKSELSDSGLLCQSVSDESSNRVDEALGLFLADAVSDDCLLLEADFAMWTADAASKSWASLAMAVISRADSKLSKNYLDRVCELGPADEACKLSKSFQDSKVGIQNPDKNVSEVDYVAQSSSLTAQVLQIKRMEKQADFAAMSTVIKNIHHRALLSFKLKNQVRALWASHALERARGVFLAGVLSLGRASREEVSAWLCLEELQQNCSPAAMPAACNELKGSEAGDDSSQDDLSKDDLQVAWAVIKTNRCSRSHEPVFRQFSDLFEKRKDFRRLVEVFLNEANLSPERHESQLQGLAEQGSKTIRRWALTEWIEVAEAPSAWRSIFEILDKTEGRDWTWQRQVLKAFTRSFATKEYTISHNFAEMVGGPLLQRWGLQKEEIVAAYKSGDIGKASILAKAYPFKALPAAVRVPASVGDFEAILTQLRASESP